MKLITFIVCICCTLILTSSSHPVSPLKKGDIFISDILSIYRISPMNGATEKVLDGQLADISYNKENQTLFSVNRGKKGYFGLNDKTTSSCDTGLSAPNYIYSYKNYVLSDSWMIYHNSDGEMMGQFGIYDISKKQLIKTFKTYGTFDAITGHANLAYVTMFGSEKNNSNVYEVNMNTLQIRPIFHTPQPRAPKIIHSEEGSSYGFYKHWHFGPANELVKMNLQTGEKETIANLDIYAYNATILRDIAVVIHFDDLKENVDIPDCITIIDLKNGSSTKMHLPGIQPTNIIAYNNKMVAVTDENGFLLLIDPFEKKVIKKHFINEGLYFLAAVT